MGWGRGRISPTCSPGRGGGRWLGEAPPPPVPEAVGRAPTASGPLLLTRQLRLLPETLRVPGALTPKSAPDPCFSAEDTAGAGPALWPQKAGPPVTRAHRGGWGASKFAARYLSAEQTRTQSNVPISAGEGAHRSSSSKQHTLTFA